jgi:AraC-like DNA-binding protein
VRESFRTMNEIHYHFVDLDSDEEFNLLATTLNGTRKNNALSFDNPLVKGELIKATPDKGLWIRKWKFVTLSKIILHKRAAPADSDKKLILIYFLNPAIFSLKYKEKELNTRAHHNSFMLSSDVDVDFSVIPKQAFYVIDIAFTVSWLKEQFKGDEEYVETVLGRTGQKAMGGILRQPCCQDEYKILHDLEIHMSPGAEDNLLVRSRAYRLIALFIGKLIGNTESKVIKGRMNYEQVMQVHDIIEENIQELPKLDVIASRVNMSVSSLLRQFSLVYGKSIYDYYLERRMELAKSMILESGISIKAMAEKLGYKQASHFIETFTKYHGYSPGSLKAILG